MSLLLSVMLNLCWAQERSRSAIYLETLRTALSTGEWQAERAPHKCGTPLIILAMSQQEKLIPSDIMTPSGRIVRSLQQTSRLSPSGHFRIHYDTTGVNTPALLDSANGPIPDSHESYVDSVAKFFDLSWAFMIDSLNYTQPPLAGIGSTYHIYIEALAAGEFGFTTLDDVIDSVGLYRRFTSSITIDNDFRFTRTTGMDGLKITAVHEFFHAIQIGAYGVWAKESDPDDIDRDFYFYELSAVWMEDVLFPAVNDYIEDLPDFLNGFRSVQGYSFSFITSSDFYQGYERSIWAHFLAKRFGADIIRRTWEAMRDTPFLTSMDHVLQEKGSSLVDEYVTFAHWNLYTGSRADTVRFYPEGHLYPEYTPNVTRSYDPSGTMSLFFRGYPLSTQYCLFSNSSDSTISVVVNVDIESASGGTLSAEQFEINLSSSIPSMPYQNLKNGLKAGFASGSPADWRIRHLEFTTGSNASTSPGPFPNPIRTNEATRLSLPVEISNEEAEVFFLSSSLDLVFSRKYPVSDDLGGRYIYIPTNDFRSSVSSGIYFIVVHSQDAEYRWKLAVIR